MNSSDDLYGFVHQFPPAINFHFCFDRFLNFADLPVEWICSGQWSEVTLHLVNRNTVIVISDASDADLGKLITDLERIFLWDKDLKFHIGKIFHFSYFLTFYP